MPYSAAQQIFASNLSHILKDKERIKTIASISGIPQDKIISIIKAILLTEAGFTADCKLKEIDGIECSLPCQRCKVTSKLIGGKVVSCS